MSGVLRLANTGGSNGRSTIVAAASTEATFTLPPTGGTLLTTSFDTIGNITWNGSDISITNATFNVNNGQLYVDETTGFVGVGLTTPFSRFNVRGSQGNWRVDSDTVAGEQQVITSNTDNSGFINYRLRTNEFFVDTNGAERLHIDNTGTVISQNNIDVGPGAGNLTSTTDSSSRVNQSGAFIANRTDGGTAEVFQGRFQGVETSRINANGTADFESVTAERAVFSERLIAGSVNSTDVQTGGIESQISGVVGTSSTLDLSGSNIPGFNSRLSGNNNADQVVGYWMNHGGLSAGIGSSREVTSQWGTDLRFYTHKNTVADQYEVYERVRIYPNGGMRNGTNIINDNNNGAGEFFSSGGFIAINNITFSPASVCFRVRTGSPSMTDRMYIRNDGDLENLNNAYGPIASDRRLKQDIVDAGSQWEDIKNISLKKFRYKNNPEGCLQIGPIAQELELVSPGLIKKRPASEDEINDTTNDLVEGDEVLSFKASILYMKAVGALQEAIERIEALESEVSKLRSN